MRTRSPAPAETTEPRRWRDSAKRIGACGAILLALSSCTRQPLEEDAPLDKKVEVFDELARKIARFTVCALEESPKTVPFTGTEDAKKVEGLRTPNFDKVDRLPEWSVSRHSDYESQWGGWFPRASVPPAEGHIGVTVEGGVAKDSDFFKGPLTVEGAAAAIADLTPGLIEVSDYPHGNEYQAVYNADVEKQAAKDGSMTIQNMSGSEINKFGDTVDGILDTLLEKNGLTEECGGVLS